MASEIERKFLVNEIGREWAQVWMPPKAEYGRIFKRDHITQGYLQATTKQSIRVRSVYHGYSLDDGADGYVTKKTTLKEHSDLQCDELEVRIPITASDILLEACNWKLQKVRYVIDHNANIFEFDIYVDEGNKGLIIAEIEFKHINDAVDFDDFPIWLGEEVTHDPRYKNSNLAKRPYNRWNIPDVELIVE